MRGAACDLPPHKLRCGHSSSNILACVHRFFGFMSARDVDLSGLRGNKIGLLLSDAEVAIFVAPCPAGASGRRSGLGTSLIQ